MFFQHIYFALVYSDVMNVMNTAIVVGLMAFTASAANCTMETSRENNIDEEWQSFKVRVLKYQS